MGVEGELLKYSLKLLKFYTEGQYIVKVALPQSGTLAQSWARWVPPAQ